MPATRALIAWLLRMLTVLRRRCRRSPCLFLSLVLALNAIAMTSLVIFLLPVPCRLNAARRCDVTRRPHSDLSIPEIAGLLLSMAADEAQTGSTGRTGSSMAAWRRLRADAYKYRYVKSSLRGALLYVDDVLQTYRKLRHSLTSRDGDDVTRTAPTPLADVITSLSRLNTETVRRRSALNLYRRNTTDTMAPMTSWQRLYAEMNDRDVYDVTSSAVDDVIADLRALPVAGLVGGQPMTSQFRLVLRLADGATATFIPHREPVPSATSEDSSSSQWYFHQMEKPTSELWTFHLDRLLGLQRAAPVVWRSIDVIRDVRRLASRDMNLEFYKSPLGDWCFHGHCAQYCGHQQPICARSTILHGSLTLTLPRTRHWTLADPWSRSNPPAPWQDAQANSGYCERVRGTWPFNDTRTLLDLVDVHLLDFLTGNMGRQHLHAYETRDRRLSTFIHTDNTKGFVRADHDELSILAPLYQCCTVRSSTVQTLLQFHTNPPPHRLSDVMRTSLEHDPLDPVLTEVHLRAFDRRLAIIVDLVNDCLRTRDSQSVIVQD